jgi:cell envelope opacity-associated protein A
LVIFYTVISSSSCHSSFPFHLFKVKLPMTTEPSKAPPLYPKTHLLAASGIAALLSLALLVFPSSDVEAKRTSLSLDLESPVEQLTQDQDASDAQQATNAPVDSPFAQIESTPEDTQQATQNPPVPAPTPAKGPQHREVIVAKGDTLSTLFEKVGLPAASVTQVLASDKQARQFTQLKHGQKLEFELTPDGQLNNLHSNVSDLESITLTKGPKGFAFNRITTKPVMRSAYVHGVINSSLSQSAARAGLSHNMTMDMASVFGYDIDFAQDIRQGDEFDVIYEQKVANGKVVGTGNILSARFTNRGKTYTAVRYTNKQGNTSYYTADGQWISLASARVFPWAASTLF